MNGLRKNEKFSDRLNFEIVSTETERGQTEPKEYDLGRHGMVILGPDQNVLWKQGGHKMDKKQIVSGIETSLEKISSGS